MNIPYVMKKCSKCGKWLVASTVNFHKHKGYRYGLNSICKECKNKYNNQWREANRDKIIEINKQYYEVNREKVLERNKQYRQNNKDKIAKKKKQYYQDNKEKISERNKQWKLDNPEYGKQYYEDNKDSIAKQHKQYCEANKEKIAKRHKQYREANKEKIAKRNKQWRENNKEKIAEYGKQYYQSPQGQAVSFNKSQRRRAKQKKQGTGITKDQWLELMNFFDWKCAYSGEKLTNKTRSIDHIVPISTGGDNMIWNMVPMTRSLNSSKHANNMEEWYREQDCYDPKRLAKIYEWQEYAYNKYGKNTQYFNTNDIQIKLI